MNPMVVMMIVQAGMQVYSMTRGGSGGIGSLLAAQTRMLVEIQRQIRIINDRLVKIEQDLDLIKDLLHRMPKETARAVARSQFNGTLTGTTRLFELFRTKLQKHGRAAAIQIIEEDAGRWLFEVQKSSSVLIADGSEALCTDIAYAWNLESQILLGCQSFDTDRVAASISIYKPAFERFIDRISKILLANETRVAELRNEITETDLFENHVCHFELDPDSSTGNSRERGETTSYKVKIYRSRLSRSVWGDQEFVERYFQAVKDQVQEAGDLPIDLNNYSSFRTWSWRVAVDKIEHKPRSEKEYKKTYRGYYPMMCHPRSFSAGMNPTHQKWNEEAEKRFLEAVLYANYFSVCKQSLDSIQELEARIRNIG